MAPITEGAASSGSGAGCPLPRPAWLTDYVYVNKFGLPVCDRSKDGRSREIQEWHRSVACPADGCRGYGMHPGQEQTKSAEPLNQSTKNHSSARLCAAAIDRAAEGSVLSAAPPVSGEERPGDGAREAELRESELARLERRVREAISADRRLPLLDRVLDRRGWKAEIPNDPFHLKPIEQRLPYFKQTPRQRIQVPRPRRHYQSNSPFFTNTIPPLKYSFTIHPSFPSEAAGADSALHRTELYR